MHHPDQSESKKVPDIDRNISPDIEHWYLLQVLEQSNQIGELNDRQAMLEQSLELMMKVAGSEIGLLYLLDAEADQLVINVARGCTNTYHIVGLRIDATLGLAGAALHKGHALLSENLESEHRWYPELTNSPEQPQVNALTLPLILRKTPVGVVQLFNLVSPDIAILQLLGNRLVADLEKLALLQAAEHANRQLGGLIDLIGELSEIMERNELLRAVTESTAKVLEVGKCSIFLSNTETGELEYHVSYQNQSMNELQAGRPFQPAKYQKYERGGSTKGAILTDKHEHEDKFRFVSPTAITIPLVSVSNSSKLNTSGGTERVIGGLMAISKQGNSFDAGDVQILETIASQTSSLLTVASMYDEANDLFIDSIKSLVAAIDAKDPYTQGHSLRVSDLSVAIAKELGLGVEMLHDVLIGSLVHDIGKIGISDEILKKPGKLTRDEFAAIQRHSLIGQNILSQVKSLHNVIPAIVQHHERMDGSGYPLGLCGEQISMMGRIVAVADVYDAMTSDRPYRKSMGKQAVFQYLKENSGIYFDADCVEALGRAMSY